MPANNNRGASTECQASADLPAQTPHHLFSATHCGVQGAPCAAVMAGRPREGKRDKEEELEKNRKVRAARVAVNKAEKAERDAAAEKSRLAKAWGAVCAAAVEEARYRLAKENPSPRKRLLRARAARQRSRVPARVPAGSGASSQSC